MQWTRLLLYLFILIILNFCHILLIKKSVLLGDSLSVLHYKLQEFFVWLSPVTLFATQYYAIKPVHDFCYHFNENIPIFFAGNFLFSPHRTWHCFLLLFVFALLLVGNPCFQFLSLKTVVKLLVFGIIDHFVFVYHSPVCLNFFFLCHFSPYFWLFILFYSQSTPCAFVALSPRLEQNN